VATSAFLESDHRGLPAADERYGDRRSCGSVGARSSMTIALTPTLPAVG
jgi:hypothetical protein